MSSLGGLVTKNISVFCLGRVALYFKAVPNSIDFYKYKAMLTYHLSVSLLCSMISSSHITMDFFSDIAYSQERKGPWLFVTVTSNHSRSIRYSIFNFHLRYLPYNFNRSTFSYSMRFTYVGKLSLVELEQLCRNKFIIN